MNYYCLNILIFCKGKIHINIKGEEYELISEDLSEDWVQAKDEAGYRVLYMYK